MRRLLILSCILVAAACSPPLAEEAGGSEIYEARCATCHGLDLEGGIGPALGEGSDLAERPVEYIVNPIKNGRGRMPAFRSSLSDSQVDRLVEFLGAEQTP